MALFAGPELNLGNVGFRCSGATYEPGFLAAPFGVTPQMMPAALPSHFGGSGLPFPAFFPGFMPFAASIPAMFLQLSSLGPSFTCRDNLLELPSESSASTGLPFGEPSPLGKQRRRATLYQGDSGSRSSLESCSGTSGRSMTPDLTEPSAGDGSEQRGSETALGPDAGNALQSLSDLEDAPSASVQMHAPEVADVLLAGERPPTAAAGAAARVPLLQPSSTLSRSEAAGPLACDPSPLPAVAEPIRRTDADPPAALGGDRQGSADKRNCLPTVGLRGCMSGIMSIPGDPEPGSVPARSAFELAVGRMPLLGPSGDVMWVDARRYRAILRRRRQRAMKGGCLAVAHSPCNRKPSRRISRRDLALLRAQATSGQLPDDDAEDESGGDCICCSDSNEDAPEADGGREVDRSHLPVTAAPGSSGPAECHAAGWAARAQDLDTFAAAAVVAAAVAAAAARAAGATGSLRADDLARAALEAELRAVLAEETGVLSLNDETTADDNGDECENVGAFQRTAII
ncbi:hypothetical protein PLESTB_000148200 [Pleodorina starrii]|uniref:Nuclear transcription factor Y subunit n=1 Tax=Pleodorina starrii TaxID=330485 RepID=A0A9W6BBN2_9CHLO|nr:hypothetical protein PLESTM_000446800 [Pleodorina starrii]GLC48788.1 hypothetical protein PLESTB_000148200 [Pleodorina starrii]GLC72528.1 hypothetical protein PLESTF_001260900 [Pleodorina starrii]